MVSEGKLLGQAMLDAVKDYVADYVARQLSFVTPRLAALEKRVRELKAPEPVVHAEPGQPGPQGPPGEKGADGKDALQIDVLSAIDDTKSYPRGTYAHFNGGEIRSFRQTDPLNGKTLAEAGWDINKNGLASFKVTQKEDFRTFVFEIRETKGITIQEFRIPVPLYRGVYRDGEEYTQGDTVTFSGSVWHCNVDGTKSRPRTNTDWQLMVKEGSPGKDLRPVESEPVKNQPVRLK